MGQAADHQQQVDKRNAQAGIQQEQANRRQASPEIQDKVEQATKDVAGTGAQGPAGSDIGGTGKEPKSGEARFINNAPRIQGFNNDEIKLMPGDQEVTLTAAQVRTLKDDPTAKALVESGDLIDVDNIFGLGKRTQLRKPDANVRRNERPDRS